GWPRDWSSDVCSSDLEDRVVRVCFVVKTQFPGGLVRRFLQYALALLRVPCQQPVLGLVSLLSDHFDSHPTLTRRLWGTKIHPGRDTIRVSYTVRKHLYTTQSHSCVRWKWP